MSRVDVAIVGAGTAGLHARRAALAAGARVEIFDPGPLGTTCARVGCMPSKLLLAAAELADSPRRAREMGLRVDVRVDPVEVMARVRRLRDGFVQKTREGIDRLGAPTPEAVRFVGPTTLLAGDRRVEARAVVLATGSRPRIPAPWRAAGEALLTNEQVFELERLPESLLVVGAGPIGLELGQAMHRLGVRVAVLDVAGTLGGLPRSGLSEALRASLGLDLHLTHTLRSVTPAPGGGVRVAFTGEDGREREDHWLRVLVAVGREPRLDGLDLAAAGLDPLPEVDPATGRVGDSAVYLAGDAAGAPMLLHEAAHEGRIAGASAAAHPHPVPADRKVPLAIVFTDPQVAMVGRPGDLTGGLDFAFQSRAKVMAKTAGRIEVHADRDGRLTGAAIVGAGAEHLGHLLAWAVQAGWTVDQALDMPFYHPVLEEGVESALGDLSRQLQARAAS